jgi:tyrosyl-tRNA synthetase
MGRELQKHFGQAPQIVMTMPILEGLDGIQKMSKSLNNYIGVSDLPGEMYRKIISMPDELIWRYFELLSFRPMSDVNQFKAEVDGGANPQPIKIKLAEEIVERFHGREAAENAHKGAGNTLRAGEIPEDLPEVEVSTDGQADMPISAVLRMAKLVANSNAARDVLGRGAVYIDGQPCDGSLKLAAGSEVVIQAGKKKIARVKLV